jgi:aryl-alcohol dehydrogenase-like predicted oxidoreductase
MRERFAGLLEKMGVDHIDLYYVQSVKLSCSLHSQSRVSSDTIPRGSIDSTVLIEHTITALAELAKAGKIGYLGL